MKGIDVVIDKQTTIFKARLWTTKKANYYGRCHRNYRDDQMIPEVIQDGNEYTTLLLNDRLDVISFFDVLPDRTHNEATVDIYFAVNIPNLYTTEDRDTEAALSDVAYWLRAAGIFTIESISEGYESWKQWGMVKKEDNMNPFFLFKFRTKVSYNLNC
jgi:hypothetical protein